MRLFDAHNHFATDNSTHDIRSIPAPVSCVTNSTREDDWETLAGIATTQPRIIPAFGVHPWFADTVSPEWKTELSRYLKSVPSIIGEIGLDRARRPDTIEQQEKVFREQLKLAHIESIPVIVHCVKAFGALIQILTEESVPKSGFMMHSYSGSLEIARRLTSLGAYFTLSTKMITEREEKVRELCAAIPRERLLIESDLAISQTTLSPQEPTLAENYQRLAAILAIDAIAFAQQIEKNFKALFGRFIRLQSA